MALLDTLTITSDERVTVKLKNHPTGQTNRITYLAYGTFGGGTVQVQVSADNSTWISNIQDGSTVTFDAADARTVECNSDEQEPVYLGFNMTASTSPSVTIKVYDNK